MKRHILLVFSLLFNSALLAQAAPTTVILVRHAEKAAQPADDPALTDAGRARAESLVKMLSASGIQAIYTSQYTRTRATAEPLAAQLHLEIQKIDANNSKNLVNEILTKHAGQKILVVGHSDTVPEIIQLLGGPEIPEIDEHQFDNLFVVTVYGHGEASVLRMKY